MRIRLTLGWLLVFALLAAIGWAQEAPTRSLSLREALDVARRYNPDYLSALNDRGAAAWQVRSTTLNLITPSASISGQYSSTQSGSRTNFFGVPEAIPALTSQSYSFGLSYRLSGQTLAARGQARAGLHRAEQDAAGAATRLETSVRTAYLFALQASAELQLAQRSLERARENQALAQARYSVGQGTLIDVRRTEVDRGRLEVAVLRAEQGVQDRQVSLFQSLGVPKPQESVVLTDSFPVTEPTWQTDQLIQSAIEDNPELRSLRARQHSARWATRSARSQFLPSLSFAAGFDASRTQLDLDTLGKVTQSNRSPWGFSLSATLPLYDGLARNSQVAQARAAEDDLRQQVRARELQVRTDVTRELHNVNAAYRTIDIQRRNQQFASEALELATQRYRVGSGSYIELLDARVTAEQADRDYVAAVYDYHRAIAALENAVGRPLR
jgi:outer membrane protein